MEEKKVSKELYDMLMIGMFSKIEPTIEDIINRAYRDMAAHTLKGINDEKEKDKLKGKASDEIIKAIKELSTKDKNQENYDAWHHEICWIIINKYNDYYSCSEKSKDDAIRFSFGQAQKWVNMTMKYLCMVAPYMDSLKNYRWIAEKWKGYLHFPMDHYILEHIALSGKYKDGEGKTLFYYKRKNENEARWCKSNIPSWSKYCALEKDDPYNHKLKNGKLKPVSTEEMYKYILKAVIDFCENDDEEHRGARKIILKNDGSTVSVYEWESMVWNLVADKLGEDEENNEE